MDVDIWRFHEVSESEDTPESLGFKRMVFSG